MLRIKTVFFTCVTDIQPQMLKKIGVDTVLLDIDNTIKYTGTSRLANGVEQWLSVLKACGVKIVLISNNFRGTVAKTAERLGIDCIYFSLKPSPFGYIRAKLRYNIRFKSTVVIGDQVFTDIFGAKICGMKSIMVKPLDLTYERNTVKLRRILCRGIYNRISQRPNFLKEDNNNG